MDRLFQEIETAYTTGLNFVALIGALAIPDMCAGLESDDGLSNGPRYKKWFDKWVASKYPGGKVTGEDCWGLRCSLLHQGRLHPHKGQYTRVIFVERNASGNVFHRNVINDALNLDVQLFCTDLIESARAWLPTVVGGTNYQKNLPLFLTRHPNGIAPYIVGTAVIG